MKTKGRYPQRIDETQVADPMWARRHWRTLVQHYRKAEYFYAYSPRLENLYTDCTQTYLSEINECFIRGLCELLGIRTPIVRAMDEGPLERSERILRLCDHAGAGEYVTGPAALRYLDPYRFARAGINLRILDYSRYRPYPQLYPPFEHTVSVVDLILNTGPAALSLIRGKSAVGPSCL